MSEQPPPSKRIRLSKDDLRHIAKEDLISRWLEQETYLNTLEDQLRGSDRLGLAEEMSDLRNSESQLKSQLQDVKKRENVLILKLAAKEQEANEYRTHIQMLKTSSTPSVTQLKSLLLDPAVNLMFQRMKTEVKEAKKKEKESHDDLQAWQFTPDSQTGKRLMARCRSLLQENESIGKMIASGRVAKIEGELALQRRLVDEMKSGQAELDVFIAELDEDVEGMQSTIYLLQQQLREARTQMVQLQTENQLLKTGEAAASSKDYGSSSGNGHHSNGDNIKEEAVLSSSSSSSSCKGAQDSSKSAAQDASAEMEREESDSTQKETTSKTLAPAPPVDGGSQQPSNGHANHEASNDDDDDSSNRDLAPDVDSKGPTSTAQEETLFTLTVKDSERQELEEGFGDAAEENDVEAEGTKQIAGKDGKSIGGGSKNKYQHDNHLFNNNGSTAKRPFSPADEEKNSKGVEKLNGSDSSTRSSRSNNATSSPAKKARGASGGSRSSRARRVSVDDADDDMDAADDRAGPLPASKGRSPRAGSRAGAGTRGTKGNALANGDAAIENGMDCD